MEIFILGVFTPCVHDQSKIRGVKATKLKNIFC